MCKNIYMCIEFITITTPNNKTKPYNLAYCWIPDLENQEWQVEKLMMACQLSLPIQQ